MAGVARECPIFADGIDCWSPMSLDAAKAFRAAGNVYAGAYLEVLTSSYRDLLWEADLGIWVLSEAPSDPLSGSFGDARAVTLMSLAMRVGVPPRVHLTIDMEACHGSETDIYDCFDHESAGIVRGGWQAASYVGAGVGLTGTSLWALPNVNFYIHAGSVELPEPIVCGFGMWQIPPLDQVILGQKVDVSKVGRDAKGRGITMWWGE